MRSKLGLPVLAGVLLLAGHALAVTEEDFMLRDAQDLVEVCSVDVSNPMFMASIHFCHGFVTGAGHYHRAMSSGPDIDPLFCPPDPQPTRSEAIAMFLSWASEQEQGLSGHAPVDALMRFAVAEWPCE